MLLAELQQDSTASQPCKDCKGKDALMPVVSNDQSDCMCSILLTPGSSVLQQLWCPFLVKMSCVLTRDGDQGRGPNSRDKLCTVAIACPMPSSYPIQGPTCLQYADSSPIRAARP